MKDFEICIEKLNRVEDQDNTINKVYKQSLVETNGCKLVVVKKAEKKVILAIGKGDFFNALQGEVIEDCKLCVMNKQNRLVINRYLEYTAPKAFGRNIATIGLGDRLGIATPGHIKAIQNRNIKPILAQQSKRELNLTGRTYEDVLNDVCLAVLQEGYKGGYGADGDHLKEEPDIQAVLEDGYTMITLDCSEKMNTAFENADDTQIMLEYEKISLDIRSDFENRYLNQEFSVGTLNIKFDKYSLAKSVMIYHNVIEYIDLIYNKHICKQDREIDFEISLDETELPTTENGHFFVASEILKRGIHINSMAPRFIGEFQKGVDYIGDLKKFDVDVKMHAQIADHFGYKLSIHSGSDKFNVFGVIGECTNLRLHIKTSGTNWLEAVRVIAANNTAFYRKMHKHAEVHFEEAQKFYHVSAKISNIKPLEEVKDSELKEYFNEDNARQLIHITYGFFVGPDKKYSDAFRNEIYSTLDINEEAFVNGIAGHIERHLDLLGIKK